MFSKYDTCTQKHDSREIDIVRLGQFRSAQSGRIERLHATNQEIRDAGDKAIAAARSLRKSASEAVPNERQLRTRDHDVVAYLKAMNEKQKFGPNFVVRLSEALSDSESDQSDEFSSEDEA